MTPVTGLLFASQSCTVIVVVSVPLASRDVGLAVTLVHDDELDGTPKNTTCAV